MSSLKGLLFSQYANEGLTALIAELQKKYKPKKGRRFNYENITYEIGRSSLKNGSLEFEISSKIPHDEFKDGKDMQKYFSKIMKIVNQDSIKPVSSEMENIVWDSKKETEKERDYVKLLFQYPLNELYDDAELAKRFEVYSKGEWKGELPEAPGVQTPQGRLALALVSETMQNLGRARVEKLIEANHTVKASLR
tara:strand:- start:119 stop:700 length:582 start_codon:yes stop_codon:yes gene_type:complete